MHAYRDGIEQALESTKSQLDKLHSDVSRTLEKISSREKYLNSQLEAPLSDLRQLQDNLAATKEQYRQVTYKYQTYYSLFSFFKTIKILVPWYYGSGFGIIG